MRVNGRFCAFTLIELLIVLAVIGIIATLAYPSYQRVLNTAARTAVQADLIAFASAMERHNASIFSYKGAAENGANLGKPRIFASYSPSSEPLSNKKYDLSIDKVAKNGLSYRLKAAPVSQSLMQGSGSLYIYSDGRKAWDIDNNGAISKREFCWYC